MTQLESETSISRWQSFIHSLDLGATSIKDIADALTIGLGFALLVVGFSLSNLLIFGQTEIYFHSIAENPFDIIFIVGMLLSVMSQTAVESFIEQRGLHLSMSHWNKIFIAKVSNFVLALLAMFSIVVIDRFFLHISFVIGYFCLLCYCDIYVLKIAVTEYNDDKTSLSAKMCKIITKSALTKIDFLSLIAILGVAIISVLASVFYSPVVKQVDGSSPIDLLLNNGIERRLAAEIPEAIMGGAIGLHLIFATWLLVCLMLDWQAKFTTETKRAADNKVETGAPVDAATNPRPA